MLGPCLPWGLLMSALIAISINSGCCLLSFLQQAEKHFLSTHSGIEFIFIFIWNHTMIHRYNIYKVIVM